MSRATKASSRSDPRFALALRAGSGLVGGMPDECCCLDTGEVTVTITGISNCTIAFEAPYCEVADKFEWLTAAALGRCLFLRGGVVVGEKLMQEGG